MNCKNYSEWNERKIKEFQKKHDQRPCFKKKASEFGKRDRPTKYGTYQIGLTSA